MKTVGTIIFAVDLLKAFYAGYTNVDKKKIVDMEELEITADNQHTASWPSRVGIGMMLIGGALLILGKKRSPTT